MSPVRDQPQSPCFSLLYYPTSHWDVVTDCRQR